MQTHILSFGIGLDFQSRHIKQSHRKVFMAFDFSHFISFLFSICVRAVRVCRSINRMNLSPRKGVRVSLLRVHVLMLLLYSQIERLMCVCVFGRACVFIQSQHQYLFFPSNSHEIQSLFMFVRRCLGIVCIQLLGIAIVGRRSVVCDFDPPNKSRIHFGLGLQRQ